MLAVGLVIGVVVEWTAVHVMGRWAYAPRMPVIPIFNIGLTPVAQMLALAAPHLSRRRDVASRLCERLEGR